MAADPPDDFAAFTARHESRLRAACRELTGNGRLADSIAMDVLVAVALRWRWWRAPGRSRAGGRYLERVLRREARVWRERGASASEPRSPRPKQTQRERGARSEPRSPGLTQTRRERGASASEPRSPRIRVVDEPSAGRGDVARQVWDLAHGRRVRRRLVAAGAVAFLGCVGLVGPLPSSPGPGPVPTSVALPPGLLVLPEFGVLANQIGPQTTVLPAQIDVDPASAAALATEPVDHAIAVLRQGSGPLLVLAPGGARRRVDTSALAGARLLSTSVSPDGRRAALVAADGLIVIDLGTGAAHALAMAGPSSLVWRSDRSVIIPAGSGATEINVDSGATAAVPEVSGRDVVTLSGGQALIELTARSAASSLPPRIRIWNDAQPRQFEDRPIFGPQWIGDWTGPGWSTSDIAVRECYTDRIPALPNGSTARQAIGAVDRNGLHAGTLVSVDTTDLDILGFADPDTVLIGAHVPGQAAVILAWNPHRPAALTRTSTLTQDAQVSLPTRP